jgi:photosystem II stability/assembly factor-like uncharacterized protein
LLLTVAFIGTTAASGATRPGSVLPTGFLAQSQTWVSPKLGWILGVSPCGQSTCTTVVGTTDGGGTWKTLGTLNAPLTLEKRSGVTEVRFADSLHGWAFDPAFWATSDGGVTWSKQTPPGAGRLVRALAGDADAVYALVSPCRLNHVCKHPPSLWRTTVSSGSWTQVPVTLSKRSAAVSAVLKVHGVVAYLVVPVESSHPDILEATTDGKDWSSRPDPCVKANDEFLVDVAPSSATNVALLCVGNPGMSDADKRVLRSIDTGQTTSPAGTMPVHGITSQIAAAPNGTLVVSSYSAGSWIYRNGGGQSWTTSASLGDGGQGWNDIAFTTNQVGFVIHGPVFCCGGHGPGELWETQDGGLTWAPV